MSRARVARAVRVTLTPGRKTTIHLPPVLWEECLDVFDMKDLDHRLFHGGLPEALLMTEKDDSFFSEWIDGFYSRDIQELFSIRNRAGFMNLLRLLLRQSGGLVDYTSLSKLSDLSRPTVKAHMEAMSVAHAIFLLPPFHGGGRREIIARPKVYTFDTGFVAFMRGWNTIREEDRGLLWEHLVLDSLRTRFHSSYLYYWRDKSGREIDFILRENKDTLTAIECKINPDQFNPKSVSALRTLYPKGENIVLSPRVKSPYQRRLNNLIIQYHSLASFIRRINE